MLLKTYQYAKPLRRALHILHNGNVKIYILKPDNVEDIYSKNFNHYIYEITTGCIKPSTKSDFFQTNIMQLVANTFIRINLE